MSSERKIEKTTMASRKNGRRGDPGFYVGWRKSIALGELGFTRLVYSVNISQNLISTKGLTNHNAAHRHILSLDMILGND
jgi:hypothetical protein